METLFLDKKEINNKTIDGYNNQILNKIVLSQATFSAIAPSQESLLFERVSLNYAGDNQSITRPDIAPSVQCHHVFVHAWNLMQPEEKQHSQIHRTYWLGDSWKSPQINEELIKQTLVRDLAEKVRRFKTNIPMHKLIPFNSEVAYKYPSTYISSRSYRDWLFEVKGNSKFDWNIINSFAKEENIKPIKNQIAFGFETDVLTKEEIELIYEELKSNSEPRVEHINLNNSSDDVKILSKSVADLVHLITQKGNTINE